MSGARHTSTITSMQDTGNFSPQTIQTPGTALYDTLHSISATQPYSHEELRLFDYAHDRGIVKRESNTHFSSEMNGLANASIPIAARADGAYTSRRTLAQRALDLGCATVTFHVGEEAPRDFTVHENLIISRSDFVRKALARDWKEARERIIPLPADEPETFELYQQWLYTGNISSHSPEDPIKDSQEYRLLVLAYVLGERFMDSTFKDTVIDAIVAKLFKSAVFDIRLSNLVYDNTHESSPLRRLLQDIYVWAGNGGWLEEDTIGEEVNQAFSVDLNKYYIKLRTGYGPLMHQGPYLSERCCYHEHAEGKCYLE